MSGVAIIIAVCGAAIGALVCCFIGFSRALQEPPVWEHLGTVPENCRGNRNHMAQVISFPLAEPMRPLPYGTTAQGGSGSSMAILQGKSRRLQDRPD